MIFRKRICWAAAAVLMTAGPVFAAPGGTPAANSCLVDVAPTADAPMALNVTMRCATSGVLSLRANSRQSASFVKLTDNAGKVIDEDNRVWKLPADPSGVVTALYRFELDAYLDETNNDMEGMRRGTTRALLLGGWLLQPLANGDGLAVSIAVDLPPGQNFAAGLPQRDSRYVLGEVPVRFAGYSVFGSFEPLVAPVPPPPLKSLNADFKSNAHVELVMLDANYTGTRQQYADWVRQSAQAIATYFDGFSSDKTL